MGWRTWAQRHRMGTLAHEGEETPGPAEELSLRGSEGNSTAGLQTDRPRSTDSSTDLKPRGLGLVGLRWPLTMTTESFWGKAGAFGSWAETEARKQDTEAATPQLGHSPPAPGPLGSDGRPRPNLWNRATVSMECNNGDD